MNIEQTIEFILSSQARAEIRMEKLDARMEKADARVTAMEKRLDKTNGRHHETPAAGHANTCQNSVGTCGRVKAQKRTEIRLAELAENQKELTVAQKATEQSLKALLDSLRHGRNGR